MVGARLLLCGLRYRCWWGREGEGKREGGEGEGEEEEEEEEEEKAHPAPLTTNGLSTYLSV